MHPDPVLKVKTLKREHYKSCRWFSTKKEQKITYGFFLCENENSNIRNLFFFQDARWRYEENLLRSSFNFHFKRSFPIKTFLNYQKKNPKALVQWGNLPCNFDRKEKGATHNEKNFMQCRIFIFKLIGTKF